MTPLDEADIHRAVCQHLTTRPAPGLVWLHVPNGGARLPTEAARFVSLGVKPGVADLILLHNAKFYALEIKRDHKARVSPAQRTFIKDVRTAGGEAEIGYGLDDALRKLERWGLLRGQMT
jgi:VRR-NUC domain